MTCIYPWSIFQNHPHCKYCFIGCIQSTNKSLTSLLNIATQTNAHTSGFQAPKPLHPTNSSIHLSQTECTLTLEKLYEYESKLMNFTTMNPDLRRPTKAFARLLNPDGRLILSRLVLEIQSGDHSDLIMIQCSIAEQGLGPIVWWKEAQAVEIDDV